MDRLDVLASYLSCRWTLDGILPNLPTPGTTSFQGFCSKLRRHGLEARSYSLEAPSSKLSDVVLTAGLLQGRINLRLSYEWLELTVPDTWNGYDQLLLEVAQDVLDVIADHSALVVERVLVNTRCHARIRHKNVEQYLAEHVVCDSSCPGLSPDGFAFNMVGSKTARLTVSRSVVHDNALFLDIYYEISPAPELKAIAVGFEDECRKLLNLVGLDIMEGREEEADA